MIENKAANIVEGCDCNDINTPDSIHLPSCPLFAPAPDPVPLHPDFELKVTISRDVIDAALANQGKWQELFFRRIPEEQFRGLIEFKGFVLNGFKEIKNNDEMRAAGKLAAELEKPLPKLTLAPDNSQRVNTPKDMRKLLKMNGFTKSNKTPTLKPKGE